MAKEEEEEEMEDLDAEGVTAGVNFWGPLCIVHCFPPPLWLWDCVRWAPSIHGTNGHVDASMGLPTSPQPPA